MGNVGKINRDKTIVQSFSLNRKIWNDFLTKTEELNQTNRSAIVNKLLKWYVKTIDANNTINNPIESKKKKRGKSK